MSLRWIAALACVAACCSATTTRRVECDPSAVEGTIHTLSSELANATFGKNVKVDFADYEGKVVLFVNVASYDVNTAVQYQLLNDLVDAYAGEDFEVVAHPSQQLGKLEPWVGADELYNILRHVRPGGGFQPKFDLFNKADLNGATATDVYKFLKPGCAQVDDLFRTDLEYLDMDRRDVRNPYEKFLVGRDGKTYFRYSENVSTVEEMKEDIDALLAVEIVE